MAFSVLMSIYLGETPENFHRAMSSIWDNQALKPDQIVLVEDGRLTTELDAAVAEWRARLGDVLTTVALPENQGLGVALNEGLRHCIHDLVARMDTDDVSLGERFVKQIQFMTSHPDVAISSAFIEEVDESGKVMSVRKLPLSHEELIAYAKARSPICHATAMFRKSVVLSVGGYPRFRKGQDYALWSLLITRGFRFANIGEPLYRVEVDNIFFERRGLQRLVNELGVLKFQHDIGFIGTIGLLKNSLVRIAGRLSPGILKKLIYKYVWS